MGGTSWSGDAATVISQKRSTQSTSQTFTNKSTAKGMSPFGLQFREARDSVANPETTAISVFLDETGSMGGIPVLLVKGGLSSLMNTMLDHNVPYPAILFGAIGDDYNNEDSPLQVGQFESSPVELDQWLSSIHLEGKGGGNGGESYGLAWLVGARHISTDSFELRQKKNFLFTIGDEPIHPVIKADSQRNLLGYSEAIDVNVQDLLTELERTHYVFHIHIDHDNASPGFLWKNMLGERLIVLKDHDAVAETIATTVAIMHGADLATITSTMTASTASSVALALANIDKLVVNGSDSKSGSLTL